MKKLSRFFGDLSYYLHLKYQVKIVIYARIPNRIRYIFMSVETVANVGISTLIGSIIAGGLGALTLGGVAVVMSAASLTIQAKDVAAAKHQLAEVEELHFLYHLPAKEKEVSDDD